MSEQQDVFTLLELQHISFECPGCGTEVIFKAEGQEPSEVRKCPECNRDIPAAGHILKLYRQLYADAKRLGATARLRGAKRTD